MSELKKIIYDEENKKIINELFYDNIRGFQGSKTRVNREIKNSLLNDKDYFGLYHNGITIIAKKMNKIADRIKLKNFQIVNGCQTTNIIALNFDYLDNSALNKMFIPIKLIATDDNKVINSIIRATNTQNEIKSEAFESLSIFHKKLEEFYNSQNHNNIKIYYERRSKQFNFVDNKIEKKNIITLAEQIKSYISVFCDNPHSTHRYYGELLKQFKTSHKLFEQVNEQDFLELYYISGLLSVCTNKILYKCPSYKKLYRDYKYHIMMILKKIMYDNLGKNTKNYKKISEDFINKLNKESNMEQYFNEAIKIINKTRKEINNKKDFRLKIFTEKLKENIK